MAPRPAGARARLLELRRARPPAPAIATPGTSTPSSAASDVCRLIWAHTSLDSSSSSSRSRSIGSTMGLALPSWAASLRRPRPLLPSRASFGASATTTTSPACLLTTSAVLSAPGGSSALAISPPPRDDDRHLGVRGEASRRASGRRPRTTRGLDTGFFDSKARPPEMAQARDVSFSEENEGIVTADHTHLENAEDPRPLAEVPSASPLRWYEALDEERLATALFATTTSAFGSSADLGTLSGQLLELSGISASEATAMHVQEASWLVIVAISKAPQDGPQGISDHNARLATLQRLYLETVRESFDQEDVWHCRSLEKLRRGALHAIVALRLSAAEHEAGGAALHHITRAAEVVSDERLKPSQARYLLRRLVALLVDREQAIASDPSLSIHGQGRGRKDAVSRAAKAAWEAVTCAAIRMLDQGALTKGGGSSRELSLAAVASSQGPATWAVEDQQKDRGLLLLCSALVDRGYSQLFLRLARAAQACLTHTHERSQMALGSAEEDEEDLVLRSPSGLFRLRATPVLSDPPPFISAKGIERYLTRLIKQGCQRAALELVYVLPDNARTLGMYARLLGRWGEADPRPPGHSSNHVEADEGQVQLATLLRQEDVENALGGRSWGWRSRRRFSTKAWPRASEITTGPYPHLDPSSEDAETLSVSQRISQRIWADVYALLEREGEGTPPKAPLALFEARFTSHARHRTPALIEADLEEMARLGTMAPTLDTAKMIAELGHRAQTSAVRCYADSGHFGKAMEVARACLWKARTDSDKVATSRMDVKAKLDPAVAQQRHATRLLNVLFRAALRNTNVRSRPHTGVGGARRPMRRRRPSRLLQPGARFETIKAKVNPALTTGALSPKTISFRRHYARRLQILKNLGSANPSSAQASTSNSTSSGGAFPSFTALPHLPSSLLHRLSGLRSLAEQFHISADVATLNMVLPYVLRSAAAHSQAQLDQVYGDVGSASANETSSPNPPAAVAVGAAQLLPSRRDLLQLTLQDPESLLEALRLAQILPNWHLEPHDVPAVDFERRVRPLLRAYIRKAFDRGEAREARRALGILFEERQRVRQAMERYTATRGRGASVR